MKFLGVDNKELEVTVEGERFFVQTPSGGLYLTYETVLKFAPVWQQMVAAMKDNILTNRSLLRDEIVEQITELQLRLDNLDHGII